jgi:hypothetical protein
MMEEFNREEKSGYKAEITTSQSQDHKNKKKEDEHNIIDTYGDDFDEEIEEDLPEENNLLDSNDNVGRMGNPTG